MVEMGSKIRRIRREKSMNLKDLATKINLDTSTISRIERGEVPVAKYNLQKIANALEIPIQWLELELSGDRLKIMIEVENKNSSNCDGNISISMRKKLVERRNELGLTLKELEVMSGVKKSGHPSISVSTLAAIERGALKKVKPKTLMIILRILNLTLELILDLRLGISNEIPGLPEMTKLIFGLEKIAENYHFVTSKLENTDLLAKLRNREINIAILDKEVIRYRTLEYTPVAMLTKSIIICCLREEKNIIKERLNFKNLFMEIFVSIKNLKEEGVNDLDLLFYPGFVL